MNTTNEMSDKVTADDRLDLSYQINIKLKTHEKNMLRRAVQETRRNQTEIMRIGLELYCINYGVTLIAGSNE